jgi:hypothetical protein
MITALVYFIIVYNNPDVERDILNPLLFVVRIIKVSIDFIVEIIFIFLLSFFIKYRKAHTEKHNFSFYNYIVLITILLLYSLCIFQSLLIFAQTFD